MKHPINGDFEKLILDGCKVIRKASINYDISNGDITHVLMECPKDYRKDEDKTRKGASVKFIAIELGHDFNIPSWYEATLYFHNKSHANKSFNADLSEDRKYIMLIKENSTQ